MNENDDFDATPRHVGTIISCFSHFWYINYKIINHIKNNSYLLKLFSISLQNFVYINYSMPNDIYVFTFTC